MNDPFIRISRRFQDTKGIILLNRMYESSLDDLFVTYGAVPALENIIRRHIDGLPCKPIAIVDYTRKTVVRPARRNHQTGSLRYELNLFQKKYDLGSYAESRLKDNMMAVKAEISDCTRLRITCELGSDLVKRIEVNHVGDVESHTSNISYHDMFTCSRLERDVFLSSSGVALKLTDPNGRIGIGGENLFTKNSLTQSYCFVFFDRGNVCVFNDRCEKVVFDPITLNGRLPVGEKRIEMVKNAFDSYRPDETSELARKRFITEWGKDPVSFAGRGRRLLLRGSKDGIISDSGQFQFQHYEGGKVKQALYAGRKAATDDAHIIWKGPYIIMKDSEGNDVGAWVVEGLGIECKTAHGLNGDSEAIGIVTMKDTSNPTITINHDSYCLSKKQYNDALSHFRSDATRAIMAHINPYWEDSFYLLVRSDNATEVFPLSCTRVVKG